MIGHRFFHSESVGNNFYLHMAIFEIPRQRFVIKPPACWGTDVSVETPCHIYVGTVCVDNWQLSSINLSHKDFHLGWCRSTSSSCECFMFLNVY